jgi:hypothetical protein
MSRQAEPYEKILFEIIREYNNIFYYKNIYSVVDNEQFKVKIEKEREEMTGRAYVLLPSGDRIDYDIRYNRIINLSENYTLLVPGLKVG